MVALAFPMLVGIAAVATLVLAQRIAGPRAATVTLTVGTVAVAVAGVALLLLYAVALMADPDRVTLCRWVLGHGQAHQPTAGLVLLAVLGLVALRTWTAWRARRRALAATLPVAGERSDRNAVDVIDSDVPIAYAHPGAGGRIVVSRGLLRRLRGEQRLVVLAHERAHLRHRHDRYVASAELAAAAVPLLWPLARAVRYHTERWADEDAVEVVGGDRRLVAETIARVALAAHPAAVSGAGGNVAGRVEALLAPGRSHPVGAVVVTVAAVVAGVGALTQLHHLAEFVAHLSV